MAKSDHVTTINKVYLIYVDRLSGYPIVCDLTRISFDNKMENPSNGPGAK